jgi:hypothetical protein
MKKPKHTARSVFERLVHQAYSQIVWDGTRRPRAEFLRKGWDGVSDRWKPGGLIRCLSEEERKALEDLTSDMTQDRVSHVITYDSPFRDPSQG